MIINHNNHQTGLVALDHFTQPGLREVDFRHQTGLSKNHNHHTGLNKKWSINQWPLGMI